MKTLRRQGRTLASPLLAFWVLMLWSFQGRAQELEFHPPASAADAMTPAVMRDLASRILPVYQESDTDRYLTNLSALQLVAGNYQAAWDARKSLRERRRKADAGRPVSKAMIYDLYAQAKAIETADHVAFAQAYSLTYRAVVPKLSDLDDFTLSGWLETPVAGFQDTLQKAFDQRRAKGNIPQADAIDLIWTYLSFDAYRSFAPLVGALDAEGDRARYASDDNIQIKTPDGAILSARLVRPKIPAESLPALLKFTIDPDEPSFAKECAAHGYVGVIAYARGKGQGAGEIDTLPTRGRRRAQRHRVDRDAIVERRTRGDVRCELRGVRGVGGGEAPARGTESHRHLGTDGAGDRRSDDGQHLPQLGLSLGHGRHREQELRLTIARARNGASSIRAGTRAAGLIASFPRCTASPIACSPVG